MSGKTFSSQHSFGLLLMLLGVGFLLAFIIEIPSSKAANAPMGDPSPDCMGPYCENKSYKGSKYLTDACVEAKKGEPKTKDGLIGKTCTVKKNISCTGKCIAPQPICGNASTCDGKPVKKPDVPNDPCGLSGGTGCAEAVPPPNDKQQAPNSPEESGGKLPQQDANLPGNKGPQTGLEPDWGKYFDNPQTPLPQSPPPSGTPPQKLPSDPGGLDFPPPKDPGGLDFPPQDGGGGGKTGKQPSTFGGPNGGGGGGGKGSGDALDKLKDALKKSAPNFNDLQDLLEDLKKWLNDLKNKLLGGQEAQAPKPKYDKNGMPCFGLTGPCPSDFNLDEDPTPKTKTKELEEKGQDAMKKSLSTPKATEIPSGLKQPPSTEGKIPPREVDDLQKKIGPGKSAPPQDDGSSSYPQRRGDSNTPTPKIDTSGDRPQKTSGKRPALATCYGSWACGDNPASHTRDNAGGFLDPNKQSFAANTDLGIPNGSKWLICFNGNCTVAVKNDSCQDRPGCIDLYGPSTAKELGFTGKGMVTMERVPSNTPLGRSGSSGPYSPPLASSPTLTGQGGIGSDYVAGGGPLDLGDGNDPDPGFENQLDGNEPDPGFESELGNEPDPGFEDEFGNDTDPGFENDPDGNDPNPGFENSDNPPWEPDLGFTGTNPWEYDTGLFSGADWAADSVLGGSQIGNDHDPGFENETEGNDPDPGFENELAGNEPDPGFENELEGSDPDPGFENALDDNEPDPGFENETGKRSWRDVLETIRDNFNKSVGPGSAIGEKIIRPVLDGVTKLATFGGCESWSECTGFGNSPTGTPEPLSSKSLGESYDPDPGFENGPEGNDPDPGFENELAGNEPDPGFENELEGNDHDPGFENEDLERSAIMDLADNEFALDKAALEKKAILDWGMQEYFNELNKKIAENIRDWTNSVKAILGWGDNELELERQALSEETERQRLDEQKRAGEELQRQAEQKEIERLKNADAEDASKMPGKDEKIDGAGKFANKNLDPKAFPGTTEIPKTLPPLKLLPPSPPQADGWWETVKKAWEEGGKQREERNKQLEKWLGIAPKAGDTEIFKGWTQKDVLKNIDPDFAEKQPLVFDPKAAKAEGERLLNETPKGLSKFEGQKDLSNLPPLVQQGFGKIPTEFPPGLRGGFDPNLPSPLIVQTFDPSAVTPSPEYLKDAPPVTTSDILDEMEKAPASPPDESDDTPDAKAPPAKAPPAQPPPGRKTGGGDDGGSCSGGGCGGDGKGGEGGGGGGGGDMLGKLLGMLKDFFKPKPEEPKKETPPKPTQPITDLPKPIMVSTTTPFITIATTSPVILPPFSLPEPAQKKEPAPIAASGQRPVVVLIVNPKKILYGGTARLAWSSVHTTRCSLYDANGNPIARSTGPDGTLKTPRLTNSTSFNIACTTESGSSISAWVSITVYGLPILRQNQNVTPTKQKATTQKKSTTPPPPSAPNPNSNPSSSNTPCYPDMPYDEFIACVLR